MRVSTIINLVWKPFRHEFSSRLARLALSRRESSFWRDYVYSLQSIGHFLARLSDKPEMVYYLRQGDSSFALSPDRPQLYSLAAGLLANQLDDNKGGDLRADGGMIVTGPRRLHPRKLLQSGPRLGYRHPLVGG
jgi:hypothetical protein